MKEQLQDHWLQLMVALMGAYIFKHPGHFPVLYPIFARLEGDRPREGKPVNLYGVAEVALATAKRLEDRTLSDIIEEMVRFHHKYIDSSVRITQEELDRVTHNIETRTATLVRHA